VSPLTVKIMHGSSHLPAGFGYRLSGGWWLSPSCSSRFCRLGCDTFSRLRHCRLSHFGRSWLPRLRYSGLFRFDHGRLSRFGGGRLSHFGRSWIPRLRYSGLFRFDHGFNRSRQFRLEQFSSAMVARMQQLDAVGFFVRPQLGVFTASALVL
jgi:hypothetical protein